ncbi:MAG: hypothetical protein Q4P84_07630 [Elusimicrobiales bacterium]|nr:hypothetical protein [Elusimicrobiales bacterium]
MKRTLCMLTLLLLLPVISLAEGAEKEILFRGIPWGSSIIQVVESLNQQGVSISKQSIKRDSLMDAWSLDFYHSYMESVDHAGCRIDVHSMNTPFSDDFRMGGYPVESIHAYCHYAYAADAVDRDDQHTQFYLVDAWIDATDEDAAYHDLKAKLTQLYGAPVEDVASQYTANHRSDTYYCVWYGAQDTAVCLHYGCSAYKEGNDWGQETKYVILTYGKQDNSLVELEQAIAREEADAAAGDLGGL